MLNSANRVPIYVCQSKERKCTSSSPKLKSDSLASVENSWQPVIHFLECSDGQSLVAWHSVGMHDIVDANDELASQ